MRRRILPYTLVVIGIAIIIGAFVATALIRAADRTVPAMSERPDVPVVVSEAGMLESVDPEVTIRVVAEADEPVVLAVGRTEDVEAWLGETAHARITGFTSWEELTVDIVDGDTAAEEPTSDEEDATDEDGAEETAAADPAGSDLWVVERTGTGSVELDWTASSGRWSLIAATDGAAPAPIVEMQWERETPTPWRTPLVVAGLIVAIIGGALLVLEQLAVREQRRRDEEVARRELGWDDLTVAGNELSVSQHDVESGLAPSAPVWTLPGDSGTDSDDGDRENASESGALGGARTPEDDSTADETRSDAADPQDAESAGSSESAVRRRPSRRELREQDQANRSRRFGRRRDLRADAEDAGSDPGAPDPGAADAVDAESGLLPDPASQGGSGRDAADDDHERFAGPAGRRVPADDAADEVVDEVVDAESRTAPGVEEPGQDGAETAPSWRAVWGFGDVTPTREGEEGRS